PPEERRELLPRVALTGMEGEIGQEGLRLPGRDAQGLRPEPGLEAAEQGEEDTGHRQGPRRTRYHAFFTSAPTRSSWRRAETRGPGPHSRLLRRSVWRR